jgi:hypothetical protein
MKSLTLLALAFYFVGPKMCLAQFHTEIYSGANPQSVYDRPIGVVTPSAGFKTPSLE